jgi:hypothetical protein
LGRLKNENATAGAALEGGLVLAVRPRPSFIRNNVANFVIILVVTFGGTLLVDGKITQRFSRTPLFKAVNAIQALKP